MSGRVPPSSRANARIPARNAIEKAARRFTRFTGHSADHLESVDFQIPRAVAVIGECDGILYTTVRDGVQESYIHEFKGEARPLLCASEDGTQLLLVGGRYKFTERGIVDKPRKKR